MLKVGAGKACINPTPDMYPIPSSFADFGVEPLLQRGIYDDMFCRAIIVDTGADRCMFLIYETINCPAAPGLRELAAEASGVPAENIIMAGTHNHSAAKDNHANGRNNSPAEVEFHEKYWEIEKSAGLEAIRQAVETMRPARAGYGEIDSWCNVNRDTETPFGYWVECRNMAGYSDKKLRTVKFVDEEGNLIAALLNYGMHNTCVHMMKDSDGLCKTSGNVSGIACRFVEDHYGNGAVAAWVSGAAGNQNPLFSHNLQYEYADGFTTSVPYPDGVGYQLMDYMGRWHGVDCVKGIDAITEYTDSASLKKAENRIYLPGQERKVAQTKHAMFRMGGNKLRTPEDKPELPELPEMVDGDPVPMDMKMLVLGDVAFLCVSGEPYSELGRDMIAASSFRNTMVLTHTFATSTGYILDKSSKDHKVFQAFATKVKPGCADDLIIDNVKALCRKIFAE